MFDAPLPGPQKFVWPVFVKEGQDVKEPINAMPGQFRMSPDVLLKELEPVVGCGIGAVLVFGLPGENDKDARGRAASRENGVVQKAVREVKAVYPDLVVCTDVCLCAYTDHGHCGPLDAEGDVDNDTAIEELGQVAVSHAAAGADIVAPSAMMDGQVAAIRAELDNAGFKGALIMSYSTKFASGMYGPFREAEQSAPREGDRRCYQASYGDLNSAIRESVLDESEGADILMVKPSLFYLDVIVRLREQTKLPVAAYNVSGEYSMMIAAADRGWGQLREMVRESAAALSRAGADIIISYWANRYVEVVGY
jgi:porphobilinogen synthase